MGSVKDLVRDNSPAGRLYTPPKDATFGLGVWKVSGRFSVGDLKSLIPDVDIKDKAEALTMSTASFFEWIATNHPEIPTCYEGILDKDGRISTVDDFLSRGERSNLIVMKLAHVPETFCKGDLQAYRDAISTGRLKCGVADVESIFRHGFPLGSSTLEKIFTEVYGKEEGAKLYQTLATYDETVKALDDLRGRVSASSSEIGSNPFSGLQKLLKKSQLTAVPNPGYVLKGIVYNSTSKFEIAGDRDLTPEETRRFSGLDEEGYQQWTEEMFPQLAAAQIEFCRQSGIINIDGKAECVAYGRKPVVTDFACTVDENRLMLEVDVPVSGQAFVKEMGGRLPIKEKWAIPSNKEIQRAIFRQEGIYSAIADAKTRAKQSGNIDNWRDYMPQVLADKKIDLKEVTEHSCNLMANAIGEVANRMLGKPIFDAPPISSWAPSFLPYASKVEYQE